MKLKLMRQTSEPFESFDEAQDELSKSVTATGVVFGYVDSSTNQVVLFAIDQYPKQPLQLKQRRIEVAFGASMIGV